MGNNKSRLALYRVYRSKSLDEIVGQDHITNTLRLALKKGQIAHAYLFSGPRGVGKTSVARILAHQINDLVYEGTSNHLDIIEIDAASNRGIDEIRDLRQKAYIAPASAKYKVYIIDEVHMLTTPAFNALLKLLEEPPSHVVLMLATTEVHKLPETIVSRTQRYSFKPIKLADISSHLKSIALKENIKIKDEALDIVAAHAYGSLRDAISLFDQIRAHGSQKAIDIETTSKILGIVPKTIITDILAFIRLNKTDALVKLLKSAREQAFSPPQLAQQIIDELRHNPQLKLKTIDLIEDLLSVAPSYDPAVKLEAVLLRHSISDSKVASSHTTTEKVDEVILAKSKLSQDQPKETPNPIASPKSGPDEINTIDYEEPKPANWLAVLDEIKKVNKSLYAILRLAKPKISDSTIYLEFNFPFHKQRAEESRNKHLLEETCQRVFKKPLAIKSVVVDNSTQSNKKDSVTNVINVMGGGSIVEYGDG